MDPTTQPQNEAQYMAYMSEQNALLNRWFEDPTDILMRLELELRDWTIYEVRNDDGSISQKIMKGENQKMNEIGVREVVSFIEMNSLNRNITLAHITEDMYWTWIRNMMKRFRKIVLKNMDRWELNRNYMRTLCMNVESHIAFGYTRAILGREKQFLRETLQEMRQVTEDISKKNDGGLFKLPHFGGQPEQKK